MITVRRRLALQLRQNERVEHHEFIPGASCAEYAPKDLVRRFAEDANKPFLCIRNGSPVPEGMMGTVEPEDGDELIFCAEQHWEMVVAAAAAVGAWLVANASYIAISIALSVISFVIQLLLAPGAAKKRDPVAIFSGLSNRTRRGDPIPVLIGEHRAVPKLISFYTELGEDGSNVYRGLYAISVGRIDSIAGETEAFDRWTRDSKRVAIGAVSGGIFAANQIFTATPSGATGRVLRPCADGDDYLTYLPYTGAVASGDTITVTGGVSTTSTAAAEENAVIDAIKINGNPLRSYKGAAVSFRPGERGQDPIPGWNVVHTAVPVQVTLDQAKDEDGIPLEGEASVGEWYTYETTQAVDRVRLNWLHPGGLYKSTPSSGGQNPYRVYYHVRFRQADDGSGDPGPWYYMVHHRDTGTYDWTLTETSKRAFQLEKQQGSPFASAFDLEFFDQDRVPLGRQEFHIGVARYNGGWFNNPGLGGDPDVGYINDQIGTHEPPGRNSNISLESVDEIVEERLEFPGVALLDLRIQATDQLNSDPVVSLVAKGIRCPVWDGVDADNPVFAWQWSNNPAWVQLALTLHPEIGIGSEMDVRDVVLPSYLAAAEHCDQLVDDGQGGTEKLATYDAYLEDEIEYWDLSLEIGATARFMPTQTGSKLRLRTEIPRERVQVFGMGNIVEGSFQRTFWDSSKVDNQIVVGFRNSALNYDPDTGVDEDDEADGPLRSSAIELRGITRLGHARREARFRRLLGQSITDQIQFSAKLDAVTLEVGDVFGFTHDVPGWGPSGLVGAGSTSTTIVIDRDVELQADKAYSVLLRLPDDSQQTRQITSPAGMYHRGDSITVGAAWADVPARNCVYAIGEETQVIRHWNCIKIERGETLTAVITAVNYDETPMTASLVLPNSGTPATPTVLNNEHAIPDDVESVQAVPQHKVLVDGTIREGIAVTWTPPATAAPGAAEVFYREAGTSAWVSAGRTTALEHVVVGSLEIGTDYDVAVAGVAVSGQTRQHPDDAPQVTLTYNPRPTRPVAPAGATAKRSGNLLSLAWTAPAATSDGVPQNRQVGRYEVRRGDDWRTAVPLLSLRGQNAELRDWVPGRESLLIRAVDTHEQESPAGAWIATDEAAAANYHLVLDRDERALGWPATLINTTVNGADRVELDAGESVGYYLIEEIDLGRETNWRIAVVGHLRQEPLHWTGEASRCEVGAVTDGPFARYETVTGGTSGATARVLRTCTDGDLYLYLQPVAGTFEAGETLTGGTSGATTAMRAGPWALLLSDPVWAERDFGGFYDEDLLTDSGTENRTAVNVRVTREDGSSTLLAGGQGTVSGRYLEVEVILATDDPTNFGVVCSELRILASEPVARVEGLFTGETDTGKVLKPDGAGGVTWV